MSNASIVAALARSFTAGEPTLDSIVHRATLTLGGKWAWLRPLARRYLRAFPGLVPPRERDAVRFLRRDHGFSRARRKYERALRVAQWTADDPAMRPIGPAAGWNLPVIPTVAELAAWLSLDVSDLLWFADLRSLSGKSGPPFAHYSLHATVKRSDAIRLIESPKPRLKSCQRRILAQILNPIPAHPAAHGFVHGRNIRTFAAPHVGQRVVLRMDVQDFFPSFRAPRIYAFLRTAGYPEPVADLVSGLCTNAVPRAAWRNLSLNIAAEGFSQAQALYARRHLPQGAPTSPALANICFYRLDCRLAGLAAAAGARYTRYADDLAFSGDDNFARNAERFSLHAAAILLEEGFHANHRKTRIMRQGARQYLTGIVTNQCMNPMRADFDRLRAILTNCVRTGPGAQNRESKSDFRAHLLGRVTFIESLNAQKGARLRRIFERIPW
ncbi:MAG TPA: reverse transcriptase family protein [Acidobacteriaceae bacterium]|nr:reverse transcriptase family protein [Acidobacteriaceae bacterium]